MNYYSPVCVKLNHQSLFTNPLIFLFIPTNIKLLFRELFAHEITNKLNINFYPPLLFIHPFACINQSRIAFSFVYQIFFQALF